MIDIAKEVLNNYFKKINGCFNGKVKIKTLPSINIGEERQFEIKDIKGNYPRDLPEFPNDFFDYEIAYFKENASKHIANCVDFIVKNDTVVEIKEYWDEQIVIDFNNNLPKSKRGKIKPWYEN